MATSSLSKNERIPSYHSQRRRLLLVAFPCSGGQVIGIGILSGFFTKSSESARGRGFFHSPPQELTNPIASFSLYRSSQHSKKVMKTFKLEEPRYEALRLELLSRTMSSTGACGSFTRVFAERVPELTRVPGFYISPAGHSHGEHWWLVDAAGNIVDPTADQFPSQGTGNYVPYDPTKHLVAKGRCRNCGCTLFAFPDRPCSAECDEALADEWNCEPSNGPYEVDIQFSNDAELADEYGVTLEVLA